MEFLTRQEAADELGINARTIDRYRINGIDVRKGEVLFLQSLSTGNGGGGPVRIPRQTIEGKDTRYIGFDPFIIELVRRNELQ